MRRTPSSALPVRARLPRRAALPVLALATVVALTGCSSGSASSATATGGPLDAILAAVYARQDGSGAAELNAQVETLTARCMAAEGFEYTPSSPMTDEEEASVDWAPDDPDWVARYGYGVVENPYAEVSAADSTDDPNAAYVATLGEGEQDAYWSTLYGDQDDPGSAGCYSDAYDQVAGDDPVSQDEFQPILDAVASFWEKLPDAPEMAPVDDAWSDCMAAAGHDFRRQPDAQQSIVDASTTVLGAEPVDDDAVATLHDDEVALAQDDLACREQTDYAARAREVQNALQQQFVDDHRSELDALVSGVGASR